MRKATSIISLTLTAVMALFAFAGCDSDTKDTKAGTEKQTEAVTETAKQTETVQQTEIETDAVFGSWKQTDEVNGNWTWTFDGQGKCHLDGETTGFQTDGTYVLDESAKTLTVNMEGWSDQKVYTYTLTDTKLDLDETYSSYHLVKQ